MNRSLKNSQLFSTGFRYFSFLFFLLLPALVYGQTGNSYCTARISPASCFEFSYYGFEYNAAKTTVTLTFRVITNCRNDLSHVAFELPNGAIATNMRNSNTNFSYTFENPTLNPFYSLKYEAATVSGYKNGASDYFYYTIPAASFNLMTTIRVEAKAAGTTETVSFNAKGCCSNQIQVTGPASVCANSSNIYSVAPVAGISYYNWIVPSGWIITQGQGTNSITVTANSKTGAVKVQQGIANCGSKQVIITPPVNKPSIINGASVACFNNTYTYTVAPVNNAAYYSWKVPSGWQILSPSVGAGYSNSITVKAGNNSGSISVAAANTCGILSGTISQYIYIAPTLISVSGPISGDSVVCSGETYIYSIPLVSGATYYNWTVPSGWQILSQAVSNGYGNSISVKAGVTPGQILVAAVNECGTTSQISKAINIAAPPGTPIAITGDTIVCFNTTYTYSVAAVPGASYYNWTVPSSWQILTTHSGNGFSNSITVLTDKSGGSISVDAVNACGVIGQSIFSVVSIESIASISRTISGNLSPIIGSTQTYSVQGQNIGSYNWSVSAGNTIISGQGTNTINVTIGSKSGVISVLTISPNGCSSDTAGISYSATPAIFVGVNLKVLLEGPYNPGTGLMATTLRSTSWISLNQPYNTPEWRYTGTESVAPNFFSAHQAIVDWVLVELRTGLLPNSRVAMKACFLKDDGSVVDIDGVKLPTFPGVSPGNYYVVVHHRNHLSVMSSALVPLAATSGNYDFTTSGMKAYGTLPMKRMANGKFGMYAGDANANGSVSTSDWNINWQVEKFKSGYLTADWNLDGWVNNADYALWYANGAKTSQVIR